MAFVDLKTLYTQSPPAFGKDALPHFALDTDYVNLNTGERKHRARYSTVVIEKIGKWVCSGSYGTPPNAVLQAAYEISREIESKPDRFHRHGYQERLNNVRSQLAQLVGAQTNECYLVPNATTGVSTVLRKTKMISSLSISLANTSYEAIRAIAAYLSDVPPHPKVVTLDLRFPMTHEEIIDKFEALLKAPETQVGPKNKRVAIIDSIVANPGVRLPWQKLVKICKEEKIWSVVDAAHSLGQEPDINLAEAQPDFWVSNCHKWFYTKRSCAVLYIPVRNQHIIKTTLPTAKAYIPLDKRNGNPNLVEQFEWAGTIDFTPYLSVNEALKFRKWLGGEEKITNYCHTLAVKGGARLAEILGTRVIDPDGSFTWSMVNVELPLPSDLRHTAALVKAIDLKLLDEHKVYSAWFFHNGKWWTRVSSQVFNDLDDFEKLGKAWLQVAKEITQDFKDGKFIGTSH